MVAQVVGRGRNPNSLKNLTPGAKGKIKKVLSEGQELFCLNYVLHGNGARAARDAGYSPKTAGQAAHLFLRIPHIRARIEELRIPAEKVGQMVIDERKERLAELARKGDALANPISAIHELNLMEHIYEPGGNVQDVKIVFVIGKGYKELS